MHNTCSWKITREGEGGVLRVSEEKKRRGHEISPASSSLLDICVSVSQQAFHSFIPSVISHIHISLISASYCSTRPWEVAGLRQYVHICKSFSFIWLNVIMEAVFWLQIKPLIATKVCESIHVETVAHLNKTFNFRRLSRPLTKHIWWLHTLYSNPNTGLCGCCYLPERIFPIVCSIYMQDNSLNIKSSLSMIWWFCFGSDNSGHVWQLWTDADLTPSCCTWFLSCKLAMIGFASSETYKWGCSFSLAMCCLMMWCRMLRPPLL